MPDQKKQGEQVASGYEMLRKLASDSAKSNEKAPKKADAPAPPPPVDTGSFGGLVKSLKDRASYAFFGPPKKEDEKK